MSVLFQNIVIALIGLVAIAFLIKKYIWSPKKKQSKSCGNKNCGC
jgi:FtsZ-interacting cell division protein ZipA